jgi:hypothetical protein
MVWRLRHIGREQFDKAVSVFRLKSVVIFLFITERARSFGRHGPATEGTRTMGWVNLTEVRQASQFLQAIIELGGKFFRDPWKKIGTSHIPYKKGISTKERHGILAPRVVDRDIGDMFRRVSRCFQNPKFHILDLEGVAFRKTDMLKLTLSRLRGIDRGSRLVSQIHMARDEISMKMGFQNMGDP